jgi:hypothetical protein
MRPGLVVILLAACSAAPPAGPAWPKLSPRTDDGGESLAPREGTQAFVAIEAEKPAQGAAVDAPATDPAAAPTGADAAAKPGTSPSEATDPAVTAEEPFMTEEIVIEIEDGPG